MIHLLAMSVGPVQEFIAAARRTRDLWFGSFLLSEISKAAAKAVQDNGGALIFPAPANPGDLDTDSPLNVANIILAELTDVEPQVVAAAAKNAAQARWREFADPVLQENRSVIREEIWHDQVGDVIEFYAAWVVITERDNYQAARARVMRLLAGRKNFRDFLPAKGRAGVPKSSLDGLRESVFLQPKSGESAKAFRNRWPVSVRRRLRMTDGEQLDVIGVVKRAWIPSEERISFPSVSRVAADSWIRGVGADRMAGLRRACEQVGNQVLRPLNVDEDGHPHFKMFPFEGTAVFRSRHKELCEEAGVEKKVLELLSEELGNLIRKFDEPNPYLAVLVADGDRMGQALSQLSSADDHRKFSQSLAGFASEAKKTIHGHQGILVYAGGDDVLAFAPVDQVLPCARKLYEQFSTTMSNWATKTGTPLTLSVGVAIAHFMEPLEDLLSYGRATEKHAKSLRSDDGSQSERDGLAVHLLKRGGGPIAVRANWKNESSAGLDQYLTQLAKWVNERAISGRVAYDLRQIAELYASWPEDLVGNAIRRDTLSILKGKQPRGEESQTEALEQFIRDRVHNPTDLRRISEELLIARQLAVALRQASGQRDAEEVLV